MSRALSVLHGQFGRATVYTLDREMVTHAHREGHIIFAVSGEPASMTVGSSRLPLDLGNAVSVNSWEPHSFDPAEDANQTLYLVLYIKSDWLIEKWNATAGVRFGANAIDVDPVIGWYRDKMVKMLLEGAAQDAFDNCLFELTQEVIELSWRGSSVDRPEAQDGKTIRDFRLRRALEVMKESLEKGEGVLLNSVASASGLSRPHFFKLFRENTGISPNVFLSTLRMEIAIDRLAKAREAISEIAYSLGFSTQASFSRFFTNHAGVAPSEFRRASFNHLSPIF